MRLMELEINNVRGIRHLVINPDQGNVVIWGSNGSGKSAVVDAIDFLLTGQMSRLTGKGTGDIKLEMHGVHIDCKPEEASVRAIISIPSYEKPIEINRCMDNPGLLQCGNQEDKQRLAPILSVALRGQHVLTRREILKYITAEPGDRAQGIQSILDLKDIEGIRKTLVKVDQLIGAGQVRSPVTITTSGSMEFTIDTTFSPQSGTKLRPERCKSEICTILTSQSPFLFSFPHILGSKLPTVNVRCSLN